MATGNRRPGQRHSKTVAAGFVGGVVTYLIGFAVIYLQKANTVEYDVFERIGKFGQLSTQVDPPTAWQVIGWLQYAAHNVDIVLEISGLGRSVRQTLPLTEGVLWERWFVLLPVVTLVLAGFVVAHIRSARGVQGGFLAGSSITLGYSVVVLGGVVVTTWTQSVSYGGLSASSSVGPEPLVGVVLAGLAYPIVLGGVGGAVAGMVTERRDGPV